MSRTIQPAAQCHIPLDSNPQLQISKPPSTSLSFILTLTSNNFNAKSENKKYGLPQLAERVAFQK
jgi:hypothetical protein